MLYLSLKPPSLIISKLIVVEIFHHERSDSRSSPQVRLESGVYVCEIK